MPFVNIRILKGHTRARKDAMAAGITDVIAEVAELPKEAIWVVFEDVADEDWFCGGTAVSVLGRPKKPEA